MTRSNSCQTQDVSAQKYVKSPVFAGLFVCITVYKYLIEVILLLIHENLHCSDLLKYLNKLANFNLNGAFVN